jgi:hypothetical protein
MSPESGGKYISASTFKGGEKKSVIGFVLELTVAKGVETCGATMIIFESGFCFGENLTN